MPFSEVAWFADAQRRVVATILRWHGRDEYDFVVLGPDQLGTWRAIDLAFDFSSIQAAAAKVLDVLKRISSSGKTVFAQNV
jgi:hypothetical protein